MGFLFFILVNATLFIRPAEMVPALAAAEEGPLRIYYFLIIGAVIFSLPEIISTLTSRPLDEQPVNLCVFVVFATCVTSHLANGNLEDALSSGNHFGKIIIYYLLLISVVNSAARLRQFVFWLLVFCTLLATVVVLQLHEIITLPTLQVAIEQAENQYTGEETTYSRLQGSGIFQDPNEMGVILASAAALACYQLSRGGLGRWLWLGPFFLFLYDIYLTRSRGALLSLASGLAAVAWLRLGWRTTLLLGLLSLPLAAFFIGGRQVDLAATQGTGQLRIQTWSDWFLEFRSNLFFGNGMELVPENPHDLRAAGAEFERVAHNSFLHAFANLGFAGGLGLLGAFYMTLWSLWRLRPAQTIILDPDLRRLLPPLLGMVAAYAVGMLTLSLSYVVPTYLMIGLPLAFGLVAATNPTVPPLRLDGQLAVRLIVVGIAYLAVLYAVVRLLLRWG